MPDTPNLHSAETAKQPQQQQLEQWQLEIRAFCDQTRRRLQNLAPPMNPQKMSAETNEPAAEQAGPVPSPAEIRLPQRPRPSASGSITATQPERPGTSDTQDRLQLLKSKLAAQIEYSDGDSSDSP